MSTTSRAPERRAASKIWGKAVEGSPLGRLPESTSTSSAVRDPSFANSCRTPWGGIWGPSPLKAVSWPSASRSFTLTREFPSSSITKSAGHPEASTSRRISRPVNPAAMPRAFVFTPREWSSSDTFTPFPPGAKDSWENHWICPFSKQSIRTRWSSAGLSVTVTIIIRSRPYKFLTVFYHFGYSFATNPPDAKAEKNEAPQDFPPPVYPARFPAILLPAGSRAPVVFPASRPRNALF